jgi:hypothetical protein
MITTKDITVSIMGGEIGEVTDYEHLQGYTEFAQPKN